jgi:transcriptional regulator with PAS, ATPase and Fis domain
LILNKGFNRRRPNMLNQNITIRNQSVGQAMLPFSFDSGSQTSNAFISINLKEKGKIAAETAEKEHIGNTLTYTNWNRKAAAKLLQISYKALLYKIQKYKLDGNKKVNP